MKNNYSATKQLWILYTIQINASRKATLVLTRTEHGNSCFVVPNFTNRDSTSAGIVTDQ